MQKYQEFDLALNFMDNYSWPPFRNEHKRLTKKQNDSPEHVELYYDNGRDGALQGKMGPGQTLRIGTYIL